MKAPLLLDRDGPVARLRLDRPEVHNALDDALITGLVDALLALGAAAAAAFSYRWQRLKGQ